VLTLLLINAATTICRQSFKTTSASWCIYLTAGGYHTSGIASKSRAVPDAVQLHAATPARLEALLILRDKPHTSLSELVHRRALSKSQHLSHPANAYPFPRAHAHPGSNCQQAMARSAVWAQFASVTRAMQVLMQTLVATVPAAILSAPRQAWAARNGPACPWA
jgi:hypothetical protein